MKLSALPLVCARWGGKKMLEAKFTVGLREGTGSGKNPPRSVSTRTMGDTLPSVESDRLTQSLYDARRLLIGQRAGEADPAVIIDGDMERIDIHAGFSAGALAGVRTPGWVERPSFLIFRCKISPGAGYS